jgi:hypothetical protein
MSARLDSIRRVAVDPVLARVECSLVGFTLAESATWLAMLIWAFERGGAKEAGIAATATLALSDVRPATGISARLTSWESDRPAPTTRRSTTTSRAIAVA